MSDHGKRFCPGQTFTIDGVQYRTVQGKKAARDVRLDWKVDGEWRPVTLDHVALILDVIADNEERLFPPPRFKGHSKVIAFALEAIRYGHLRATHNLHLERMQKTEQQEAMFS